MKLRKTIMQAYWEEAIPRWEALRLEILDGIASDDGSDPDRIYWKKAALDSVEKNLEGMKTSLVNEINRITKIRAARAA